MKTKHTPNRHWWLKKTNMFATRESWDLGIGEFVADYGVDPKESEANAKLIAAAPEMLDALQSCRESLEAMNRDATMNGMLMVIQQAIKSATT